MTKLLMEKDGETISVDSSAVTANEALGWSLKRIRISEDGQTLEIPRDAGVTFIAGATTLSVKNVLQYSITPEAASATYVLAATALDEEDEMIVTSGITQPDVPRVLTVKGSAASQAGNVLIEGQNINGEEISETIALDEGNEVEGTLTLDADIAKNLYAPAGTPDGSKPIDLIYLA